MLSSLVYSVQVFCPSIKIQKLRHYIIMSYKSACDCDLCCEKVAYILVHRQNVSHDFGCVIKCSINTNDLYSFFAVMNTVGFHYFWSGNLVYIR